MPEPPPISVVAMMRSRLPDGYALVSKADLELAAGQLPANHAAVARIRTALDGRLTGEEQEAWDAYAAERLATAKPDSREAIQARIEAPVRATVAMEIRARRTELGLSPDSPEDRAFARGLETAARIAEGVEAAR